MTTVSELWISVGEPKVRRSYRKARLFWLATEQPDRSGCVHLLWDEGRGVRGPWCQSTPVTGSDRCRNHGGTPARKKSRRAVRSPRWTIEAEIDRTRRLVETVRLISEACMNLNEKREPNDL